MIKTTEVTKVVKIKDYYCDVCGNRFDSYDLKICDVCGKHLCKNCASKFDKEFDGESPSYYCKRCWNIGVLYRGDIEEARRTCEDTVRRLENSWVMSAKKAGD